MLIYYRGYIQSFTESDIEEHLNIIHAFYCTKAAILIVFFSLLRPEEIIQIKVKSEYIQREKDDGCIKIKIRSSLTPINLN
jgi:hypothetical protein